MGTPELKDLPKLAQTYAMALNARNCSIQLTSALNELLMHTPQLEACMPRTWQKLSLTVRLVSERWTVWELTGAPRWTDVFYDHPGGGIWVASLLSIHIIEQQNFSISVVCCIALTQHLCTPDLLTAPLLFSLHHFVCCTFPESAHRFPSLSIFLGISGLSSHVNITVCSFLRPRWRSSICSFLSFHLFFF